MILRILSAYGGLLLKAMGQTLLLALSGLVAKAAHDKDIMK